MFGAIAGGIASALAGGAMSKLFGGGQKAASGGIQGDVLATDNNTVGMGDAGIKSAIQGSNVPNPDEAVPSFVSGAMAKAGKGLLEGTLQAGTSAVSDKLLDLVGLGGKSAADKGKDTRDYRTAAFPELNAWERAVADASSAGMVDAGLYFFSSRSRLPRCSRDWSSDVCSSDLDPSNVLVETHVNGARRQSGLTSLMTYPPGFLVGWISRMMTLMPGDVIATGTPAGVGPLVAGDTVEVSVAGVGVLRNPVYAPQA